MAPSCAEKAPPRFSPNQSSQSCKNLPGTLAFMVPQAVGWGRHQDNRPPIFFVDIHGRLRYTRKAHGDAPETAHCPLVHVSIAYWDYGGRFALLFLGFRITQSQTLQTPRLLTMSSVLTNGPSDRIPFAVRAESAVLTSLG